MRELTAGMYELIDEIAPGGAGAAHEVRDTRGDSLVRVRLGSDRCVVGPDVERRVEQACRLQHDHIVPVLGLARRGSGQYVVEQPVEGERLDVLLEERRALSPVEALSIARQLADALVYAHEHGVVHGCVSPAAVVIQDAARPRAMLAGFGSTGIILPYVAPERSEEHTSELQSQSNLVCRLLLEKKKHNLLYRVGHCSPSSAALRG